MCCLMKHKMLTHSCLGILLKQRNTQVIYVGDAHQQIYAWRGAVNAMQQLPLPESRLTTSFPFW